MPRWVLLGADGRYVLGRHFGHGLWGKRRLLRLHRILHDGFLRVRIEQMQPRRDPQLHTGRGQSFVVPTGVTQITVLAHGAEGFGAGGKTSGAGGLGSADGTSGFYFTGGSGGADIVGSGACCGGGGGGGYYGGGGGGGGGKKGASGGGGGGSSYAAPLATGVSMTAGDWKGNGQVVITW